jgi:hypothetical protein
MGLCFFLSIAWRMDMLFVYDLFIYFSFSFSFLFHFICFGSGWLGGWVREIGFVLALAGWVGSRDWIGSG